ncbi:MAG: dihydrodipicolinate synthase family protein [Rhizobiales bacterium]|nr:dihydrodipicolinate synthase family protein [Hyphomicrobiales bacterium]NRB14979.1 dihydrodipicolinate synthase family protein [Hyphomicrobiales bacterium]
MAIFDETAAGVYVIAVTPFTAQGELDLASTDNMVDFYLNTGVNGMTILGMMGEAPKLTTEESQTFVKRVIKRVAGRVPIIVGVSAPGFAQMKELSDWVMNEGADGVMIAPPGNLKTDDQIYKYYVNAANIIGHTTPFVLQDFPLATGVVIPVSVILKIVADVPNCVCLKHEDWPGLAKITEFKHKTTANKLREISILCGNGGLYLPEEMHRGADGAMTGFSYPEMMVKLVNAHQANEPEKAREIFDAYLPLVRYEAQPVLGLAIRKYILAKRGCIATPTLRAPAPQLSQQDIAEIETLIIRQTEKLNHI